MMFQDRARAVRFDLDRCRLLDVETVRLGVDDGVTEMRRQYVSVSIIDPDAGIKPGRSINFDGLVER